MWHSNRVRLWHTPLIVAFALFATAVFLPLHTQAQSPAPPITSYYSATVTKVTPLVGEPPGDTPIDTVEVTLRFAGGKRDGQTVTAIWSNNPQSSRNFTVHEGSKVLVMCTSLEGRDENCDIISQQRITPILTLSILFLLTVWLTTRQRGIRALIAMAIGTIVIVKVIIPLILLGWSPIVISFLGGLLIILPAIYISHGFSMKSHITLASIVIVALITAILSLGFSRAFLLMGMGSEESIYLNPAINLQAVLISAIVLGILGVIDDLAMTQVSIVNELYHSNPTLSPLGLFNRAMKVGHDHITSVINTLFLAYVGVSLPLLILIQQNKVPTLIALQQESIATELLRIMIGTIGLMLVVPLSTYLTSTLITRYPERFPRESHHHIH